MLPVLIALTLISGPAEAQDLPLLRLKALAVLANEELVDRPLLRPEALSLGPDGRLFIADTGNNRVLVLNRSGEVVREVSGFGWGKDQFDRPVDIFASSGLDVFIADYNNRRVVRYDKDLNYLSSFTTEEQVEMELQLGYPSGVALSSHGELFVVDNENRRVLKIDSFGDPEFSFGDFSYGEGSLEDPMRIEISHEDLIYVSDAGRRCVVVFDYYGNYVGRIGERVLTSPAGLKWADGKLWVADPGADQIVLFDEEGNVLGRWNVSGEGIGALGGPVDVDILDEKLFVLERDNRRIQVFDWLDAQKRK
jgi:DNA-binding beta-propeller fold protein YncE